MKCEYCGKELDYDFEEEEFSADTFLLSYSNLRKTLCANCAIKAIDEDLEDGIYFEVCEHCGKEFDLVTEEGKYERAHSWENGTVLRDIWDLKGLILCSDCAIDLE